MFDTIWAVTFLLVTAHFLCDYSLQSGDMAVGKNRHINATAVPWYYWMFAHSSVHALSVALITGSIILGLLELVLHFIIDVLKCEKCTNIHQDQLFHMLCKLLWALSWIAFLSK